MSNNIFENIDKQVFEEAVKTLKNNEVILMKFTAEWCGPCKTIKPLCDSIVSKFTDNMYYIENDIDEALDLYVFFKKQKIVNGIPALYLYYGNENRKNDPKWYLPDYSVSGVDKNALNVLQANLNKYIKL